jgi:hypothetical protein
MAMVQGSTTCSWTVYLQVAAQTGQGRRAAAWEALLRNRRNSAAMNGGETAVRTRLQERTGSSATNRHPTKLNSIRNSWRCSSRSPRIAIVDQCLPIGRGGGRGRAGRAHRPAPLAPQMG